MTAALGAMLLPLNSTMIAIGLPDIARSFGVSLASTTWLVSAYLIAQAALQPLAGKLGDRYGRRPLILGGLGAFAAASLAAGLAPSLGVLVICRTLQAVTGAMVFPNALAVIREALPEERRGTAFGTLGAAIGLAAAIGPPLGGALVALGGWRAIFLVNLPWTGVAAWMALRHVRAGACAPGARFDVVGALALSTLLALGAWLLHPAGAPAWVILAGTIALVGCGAAFVRYELGLDDPMLQPRFLRVKAFAAATGSVGLSNLALYGTLLAVPVLLAGRTGWSSTEIGIAIAAMSFPLLVLSPVGGWVSDRAGRRTAAVGGLTLLALAMVPLAVTGGDVTGEVLIIALACAGAGLGLSNAAVQAAGLEALHARDAGVAAGIFSTGRYIGGIAAASLVAALVSGGQGDFGLLFAIQAAAAALSALLALRLPGRIVRRVPAAIDIGGAPT